MIRIVRIINICDVKRHELCACVRSITHAYTVGYESLQARVHDLCHISHRHRKLYEGGGAATIRAKRTQKFSSAPN